MKALICTKYGSPEVLQLEEVAKPFPKDDEVLVKIHASSVNYNILVHVSGKPFLARLMGMGFSRPKFKIPGGDIAGQVEAIGRDVKQYKPGDEVFGELDYCGYGAWAEYVSVPEKFLSLKPANISYEEAAVVPQAALVALQAIRDYGKMQKGQKVLIYGASGGIGTFAVQIAKAFGGEVTGVCSTKNLELVRSIGADHVIDYTQEDFTKNGQLYDLIVATAGYRSVFDYKRALTPTGIHVVTGGSMKGPHALSQIFQPMFMGPWITMFGKRKMSVLTLKIDQRDLIFLKELIEAGKVKPVIDRRYTLSEAIEALRYYGQERTRGKIVISME